MTSLRSALLLLCCIAALAVSAPLCLQGDFQLAISVNGTETPYCNSTSCAVALEIQTDDALIAQGNWPLLVLFSDGSYLTDHFPTLDSVNFTCDASTTIVAQTTLGAGAERLRIVWSYNAVASTNCAYILANSNWTADYLATQVLLADSGNGDVTSFDAAQTTTAASLASMQISCPSVTSTTGTSSSSTTGTTGTTGTSSSTTGGNTTTTTTTGTVEDTTSVVHATNGSSSAHLSDSGTLAWLIVLTVVVGVMILVLVIIIALYLYGYFSTHMGQSHQQAYGQMQQTEQMTPNM